MHAPFKVVNYFFKRIHKKLEIKFQRCYWRKLWKTSKHLLSVLLFITKLIMFFSEIINHGLEEHLPPLKKREGRKKGFVVLKYGPVCGGTCSQIARLKKRVVREQ